MGVWVLQNKEMPDTEICQALLDRILSSPQLKRSVRMRELLAYVGRRALEEGCEQLHEQEIGTEVFGRGAGYDTSSDNIVRVNATELRKRIDAYFESEGANERLIMEIPRGSYIPVFRYRPVESPVVPSPAVPAAIPESEPHLVATPAAPVPTPVRGWPWIAGGVVAGLAIVALGVACVSLSLNNRAMHRQLYPWEYKPAVAAFWTGFLGANPTTDIVMADTGFGMFQVISKQSFTLQDYLTRNYSSQLEAAKLDPQLRSALALLARRTLISRGGFTMAQHIQALEPLGNRIHLYFARTYTPSLIKRDNVILFGTQLSNPWMELFQNHLVFAVQRNPNVSDPEMRGAAREIVTNRAPITGEQATYTPTDTFGYCTADYLPNPEHTGRVLLIEGTSSDAAQGCGDFLLSQPGMSSLETKLGKTEFPYFQVLLRTSQLIDTPMTATIVAVRSSPTLH